jgi:hypothetical protein
MAGTEAGHYPFGVDEIAGVEPDMTLSAVLAGFDPLGLWADSVAAVGGETKPNSGSRRGWWGGRARFEIARAFLGCQGWGVPDGRHGGRPLPLRG